MFVSGGIARFIGKISPETIRNAVEIRAYFETPRSVVSHPRKKQAESRNLATF